MGNFVLMPKLGMTMTAGKITKWLVTEGKSVQKGEYIFEVETDKTTLEVDSLYEGVLRKIYFDELSEVPVNTPVAYIGGEKEEIPPLEAASLPMEQETAPEKRETPVETIKASLTPQKSATVYDFDLIVVGAGPGGYVAAIRAAQLGAKVAVAEKDRVGGTCLNRGCIPTKALHQSAKEWKILREAAARGFSVKEASFDWGKIIAHKNDTVLKLVSGVEGLLAKNGVALMKGAAEVRRAHEVLVNGTAHTAKNIVLATGGVPVAKIKSQEKLFNTDDILDLTALPRKIVIIGGGVVGCEMACILHEFGVDTTVVEFLPRILPMFDADLSAALAQNMARGGIELRTSATVAEVAGKKGGYTVKLTDGSAIACDLVLEAIGRRADTSAFSGLGVACRGNGFVAVDEFLATNVEGVYAIGDLNGISQLAHSASHQGMTVAEHLFGGLTKIEQQPVPACVFAGLEIASVGKTLREAKEEGVSAREYAFPYAANGKALSMHAQEGFVKVVYDDVYGEILGVHIAGEQASTLIHEAVVAMRAEMTVHDVGHTIHAHPTLSETLMEAFLGCSTGAIHI